MHCNTILIFKFQTDEKVFLKVNWLGTGNSMAQFSVNHEVRLDAGESQTALNKRNAINHNLQITTILPI